MAEENKNQSQPTDGDSNEVSGADYQKHDRPIGSGRSFRKRVKLYTKIFLVIVLIGITGYAYYIVDKANKLTSQAETLIDDARKYNFIADEIRKERDNCVSLLSPSNQQADFGTFKYCEKFIEWSNKFFAN